LALPFIPSDAGLLILQAGVVASPRPLGDGLRTRVARLRGPGWALIPVVSIVGVIFMIRYASGTANWLTYLALVAVPILAAVALGWGSRWSWPWLALAAAGLFVLAWRTPYSLAGEAAGALLSGLSCVTLGMLLAAVTPPRWLKLGIIAMACADVWLVTSDLLQAPNDLLSAAAPGGGLPQLQSEQFGTVTLGYGDLFVAALLGGVLSDRPRLQTRAALLTFALAALFDLLFLAVDELPATVPVALATILIEVRLWRGRGGRVRPSGRRARWRRADAIPPPVT
jgi:hypothetical protein